MRWMRTPPLTPLILKFPQNHNNNKCCCLVLALVFFSFLIESERLVYVYMHCSTAEENDETTCSHQFQVHQSSISSRHGNLRHTTDISDNCNSGGGNQDLRT
ncbi:hypothetical protein AAHE18_01G074400 [Arachis hypogaea]